MNAMVVADKEDAQWWTLTCAILQGKDCAWPMHSQLNDVAAVSWLAFIAFHGVDALLADRLDQLTACPDSIVLRMKTAARERAAWELRHRALLQNLTNALQYSGVESLFIKGTALAYTLYQNPVWRSRGDTDLWIDHRDQAIAVKILNELGFQQQSISGEGVVTQSEFVWWEEAGNSHAVDLHWQFSNSPFIYRFFDYSQIKECATAFPAHEFRALAPSPKDALLIACVHRAMHQKVPYTSGLRTLSTGDRLIWLYDIDQLARTFSPNTWQEFVLHAQGKQVAHVCYQGLLMAQHCFETPLPGALMTALQQSGKGVCDAYLQAGSLSRLWMDLWATRGSYAKMLFSWRLLFPPGNYMKEKYSDATVSWLPWLYLRRVVEGVLSRTIREDRV